MNLRLKPFEKKIRRRVRGELRRSPAAWKEYRRVRKRREFNIPFWGYRCIGLLVVCSIWTSMSKPIGTVVAMTLLWAVATLTWRANQLLIALRGSSRLLVFAHLPMSDQEVFECQWQSYLQVSAWSILDFTALYDVLAYRAGYGGNSLWAGLFMALAQWLVVVTLAAGLVIFVRNRRLFRFAGLCATVFGGLAAALAVSFTFNSFAGSLAVSSAFNSLTGSLGKLAFWIPPTGWILYALGISPPQNLVLGWWPALAMSAVIFSFPLLYRRLRVRYVMPEGVSTSEAVRGAVEAQRRQKSDGVTLDPCADIKAAIRSRQFISGFDWKRSGWSGRWTARWLTPEECVVAEFLGGAEPRKSRGMLKTAMLWVRVAVLGCLVLWIAKSVPFLWFMLIFSSRDLLVKGWPGTALRNVSGSNMAMCSVYPLGYWQMVRVFLKFNLVRTVTSMPFLLVIAFFALRALDYGASDGIRLVGKILVFILAIQFFFPILCLSAGTDDSSIRRMIWLTVVAAILLVGSCIALFFTDGLAPMLAAAAALLGGSISALLVYGHAYNHNWFDLQNKPKTTTPAQSQ